MKKKTTIKYKNKDSFRSLSPYSSYAQTSFRTNHFKATPKLIK